MYWIYFYVGICIGRALNHVLVVKRISEVIDWGHWGHNKCIIIRFIWNDNDETFGIVRNFLSSWSWIYEVDELEWICLGNMWENRCRFVACYGVGSSSIDDNRTLWLILSSAEQTKINLHVARILQR